MTRIRRWSSSLPPEAPRLKWARKKKESAYSRWMQQAGTDQSKYILANQIKESLKSLLIPKIDFFWVNFLFISSINISIFSHFSTNLKSSFKIYNNGEYHLSVWSKMGKCKIWRARQANNQLLRCRLVPATTHSRRVSKFLGRSSKGTCLPPKAIVSKKISDTPETPKFAIFKPYFEKL
jgi:hypothetical protein